MRAAELVSAVLVCASVVQLSGGSPVAIVRQGRLAGSWMTTRGGRRVAAFRGVPYATPPVGNLRFQSPKPATSWPRTKMAREDGSRCVQFNHFLGIYGEEDCLYINIYTPNMNGSAALPVLFFIHGGAFKTGSGGSFLYGPKYLLDEDIVLVTVNYRLSIFGFLSFEDDALPGNLGLKDQRAALRWVRDNIEQFGGDPKAVTIFGESAGAASVHYHMLFNSEEGLFRAGICHSGSALTAGSFQRPGEQRPLVEHLLTQTGCHSKHNSAAVECLRKVRPYKLLRTAIAFFPAFESLMRNVELAPVVEPDCVEDAFVTADPWTRTSSLPLIIGTNQYEALFTIADITANSTDVVNIITPQQLKSAKINGDFTANLLKDRSEKTFEEFDRKHDKILPYNLMFERSAEDPLTVAQSIRKFYLEDNKIDREHVLQFVNMLSDGIFNYGTTETVQRNLNDTYLYSFNYLGSKSLVNLLGYENNFGPSHVDELFLFFPFPLRQIERNRNQIEDDQILSEKLIKIWTDFATYLEPTPDGSVVNWRPVSSPALEHLSIDGPHLLAMDSHFYSDRMAFWANLPFRNKPSWDSLNCTE